MNRLMIAIALCFALTAQAQERVSVMTYNIWVGGTRGGQELSQTVEVIKAAGADIIGMQERNGNETAIAEMLGFHAQPLGGSTAILSRWPIVSHSPNGAVIETPDGGRLAIYNVHLAPYPYQPYDLRDEKIKTEAEAIDGAKAARSITAVLEEMSEHLASGMPVFLTGDFNEPSHLDWTDAAAKAGLFPIRVEWPLSKEIVSTGLKDGFRAVHPDPVEKPAVTWTPGYPPPEMEANEVHDRIDIVYFAGDTVKPLSAKVIGPDEDESDIVVTPYPSDHRAVVVEFDLGGKN